MGRNASSLLAPAAGSLGPLVEDLRRDGRLGRQIVHATYLPAVPAYFGELDPPLAAPIARALAAGGVPRLWSHQAEGIAAARRAGCEIYDGDTPRPVREAIRREFSLGGPRVIVSNPDMLHLGVLGHWTGWGPFFADLRWIVLDELHTYRGIFGSHFHHVLQRFLRLCRAVGGNPTLIASSATVANAAEFAETLAGRPFHWIAESGAPREERHLDHSVHDLRLHGRDSNLQE